MNMEKNDISKEIFQEAYMNMLRIIIHEQRTKESSNNPIGSYEIYEDYKLINNYYDHGEGIYIFFIEFNNIINESQYNEIGLWVDEVHNDLIKEVITHYIIYNNNNFLDFKKLNKVNIYDFIRCMDKNIWMKPINDKIFINIYEMLPFDEDKFYFLPINCIKKYIIKNKYLYVDYIDKDIQNKYLLLKNYEDDIYNDYFYMNDIRKDKIEEVEKEEINKEKIDKEEINKDKIKKEVILYHKINKDIKTKIYKNEINENEFIINNDEDSDNSFIELYAQIIVKQFDGSFLKYNKSNIVFKINDIYHLHIFYIPNNNRLRNDYINYLIIIENVLEKNIFNVNDALCDQPAPLQGAKADINQINQINNINNILVNDCKDFLNNNNNYWIYKSSNTKYINILNDFHTSKIYMKKLLNNIIISQISIKSKDITFWTPPNVAKIYDKTYIDNIDKIVFNKELLWKYENNKIIIPVHYITIY